MLVVCEGNMGNDLLGLVKVLKVLMGDNGCCYRRCWFFNGENYKHTDAYAGFLSTMQYVRDLIRRNYTKLSDEVFESSDEVSSTTQYLSGDNKDNGVRHDFLYGFMSGMVVASCVFASCYMLKRCVDKVRSKGGGDTTITYNDDHIYAEVDSEHEYGDNISSSLNKHRYTNTRGKDNDYKIEFQRQQPSTVLNNPEKQKVYSSAPSLTYY